MRYIFSYNAPWGRKIRVLPQAKNMSEAIKEALIVKICELWGFDFTAEEQLFSVDFSNFDVWLIGWLKTTRYWDIPAINKNVEESRPYYGTLKENVLEHLRLIEWRNDDMVYEINDEKNVSKDLDKMKDNIVGEAVLKEIEQIQAEKEKKEYERLKKKFEVTV